MRALDQFLLATRVIRAALVPSAEEDRFPTGDGKEPPAKQRTEKGDRVALDYEARIEQLRRSRIEATHAGTKFLRYAVASFIVLVALLALSLTLHIFPFWWAGLLLIPLIFSIEKARRRKAVRRDTAVLIDLYQRGLARVRHEWMGKGDDGSDLELPGHLSSCDLDLFGDGSMFELLCDVGTPMGRETLARWLQIPASTEEVISRQRAVQHLRDRSELREKLALLREGDASEYSWAKLREWLASSPIAVPNWAPWLGMVLSAALIAVCVLGGTGVLQTAIALWVLGAIVAAEVALALSLRRRIRPILFNLHLSARKVESLRRLSALVREQRFKASKLVSLQRKLQGSSERIAKLQRLIRLLDLRNNEWTVWPFMLALVT